MVARLDLVRYELGRTAPATRAIRRGWRAACLLAVALGCDGQKAFPGSASDLDDLGRQALAAFERGDADALASLRLTEAEHNGVVWPELPAAQGPSPFPVDMAWQNIELRNGRAIPRAAEVLEWARPIAFESVSCEGEIQSFASFQVHTDCYIVFGAREGRYRLQLFKDVLERHGGFKIFRYYDEDLESLDRDSVRDESPAPSRS